MEKPVAHKINPAGVRREDLPIFLHLKAEDSFQIPGDGFPRLVELLLVWPHDYKVVHVPHVVFHAVQSADKVIKRLQIKVCEPLV